MHILISSLCLCDFNSNHTFFIISLNLSPDCKILFSKLFEERWKVWKEDESKCEGLTYKNDVSFTPFCSLIRFYYTHLFYAHSPKKFFSILILVPYLFL